MRRKTVNVSSQDNKVVEERIGKGLQFEDLVYNQIERVNRAANEGHELFINSVEVLDGLMDIAGKDETYRAEVDELLKGLNGDIDRETKGTPSGFTPAARRRLFFSYALRKYGIIMGLIKRRLGPPRHVTLEI